MTTRSIDLPIPSAEGLVPLPFPDRLEAGRLLARRLAPFRGQRALVLGIPRGGVPVAREVAQGIDGELDVVVARKLGAPFQEELAIGAVTADGERWLNRELVEQIGVPPDYLERVTALQLVEAKRREARFRGAASPPVIKDRLVIVVDDGLATGATMRAAIRAVRAAGPRKLVVAVPVSAPDTCRLLATEVDEMVCLATPEPFWAVGQYYRNFAAVSDDEVEAILRER